MGSRTPAVPVRRTLQEMQSERFGGRTLQAANGNTVLSQSDVEK